MAESLNRALKDQVFRQRHIEVSEGGAREVRRPQKVRRAQLPGVKPPMHDDAPAGIVTVETLAAGLVFSEDAFLSDERKGSVGTQT